jgi:hypothetical protein
MKKQPAALRETVADVMATPGMLAEAKLLLVACALEGRPMRDTELAGYCALRGGEIDTAARWLRARGYAGYRDGVVSPIAGVKQ